MRLERQSTGQKFRITPGSALGAGGEARIYAVSSGEEFVAKIYHEPTEAQARKLAVMIANPPDDPMAAQGHVSIAWPADLIQMEYPPCGFLGYLMPRVTAMRPVFNVYNPLTRRQESPLFNYRYLVHTARNLASAVRAVHARGYVIGDVNESNILVSETALVTLVDTDSFQVRDPQNGAVYRCPVGKPDYTPPELQGRRFAEIDRSPEHDLFGLAVLLFQLLMEGTHPFAGIYQGSGDPPPYEERIIKGHYPHGAKRAPYRPMPLAPSLEILPVAVRALFTTCFEQGHLNPSARPDAQTWQRILKETADSLAVCSANERHVYSDHLPACPWCSRAVLLGGRDPFPLHPPSPESLSRLPRRLSSSSGSVSSAGNISLSSGSGSFSRGGAPPAPLPFPRNGWAWGALGWAVFALMALPLGLRNLCLFTGLAALGFGLAGWLRARRLAGVGRWVSAVSVCLAVAALGVRPMLASRELHTLKEETGGIETLAFSPDGKTLACGTSRIEDQTLTGGEVDLWDTDGERFIQKLAAYHGNVVSVSYAPDGKSLAVGIDSALAFGDVQIVNSSIHGIYRSLPLPPGHVRQLLFSPDGSLLACAGRDKMVRLWDVSRETLQRNLVCASETTALAFSPDSRRLAIGTGYPAGSIEPGRITVFDLSTGRPCWTQAAHSNSVMTVAFSPDGRLVASGGKDDKLCLWDAATGALQRQWAGNSLWTKALAFSPDSRMLAGTTIQQKQTRMIHEVSLWDVSQGHLLQTFSGKDFMNALAFSPDGGLLAMGSRDGTIRLRRLPKKRM